MPRKKSVDLLALIHAGLSVPLALEAALRATQGQGARLADWVRAHELHAPTVYEVLNGSRKSSATRDVIARELNLPRKTLDDLLATVQALNGET